MPHEDHEIQKILQLWGAIVLARQEEDESSVDELIEQLDSEIGGYVEEEIRKLVDRAITASRLRSLKELFYNLIVCNAETLAEVESNGGHPITVILELAKGFFKDDHYTEFL